MLTYEEFLKEKEEKISQASLFRRRMPIGTVYIQRQSNGFDVLKIIDKLSDGFPVHNTIAHIREYEYREEFKDLICLEY